MGMEQEADIAGTWDPPQQLSPATPLFPDGGEGAPDVPKGVMGISPWMY